MVTSSSTLARTYCARSHAARYRTWQAGTARSRSTDKGAYMRLGSVLSEALRNIGSGVSRAFAMFLSMPKKTLRKTLSCPLCKAEHDPAEHNSYNHHTYRRLLRTRVQIHDPRRRAAHPFPAEGAERNRRSVQSVVRFGLTARSSVPRSVGQSEIRRCPLPKEIGRAHV